MNIRDLFEVELENEFTELDDLEKGSEEHKRTVSDISQLTDRLVRLKELENEKEKIEIERSRMEADKGKIDIERGKLDIEKEKINIEKSKIDAEKGKVDIEKERIEIDRKKIDEDKKNRLIDQIISVASIVVPTTLTGIGMVLMFLYEEKGTITSAPGRKVVDRIFRGK